MNFPLFIAKRIYSDKGDHRKVSRPAIRIATVGVAIGLAVMIVTVSVVLGFKHTIRDKVAGFGSHIQVYNLRAAGLPICIDDSTLQAYEATEGVRHAERFTMAQGILKTDDDFLGVMFKGIGPEYDTTFISENLIEGELPKFSDSKTKYPLVLSKYMANKLRVKTGDRIFAYFIDEDDVKARRFTVCGIYQTNMKRFDDQICITDLYVTQRINGYDSLQCTGAELLVNDFEQLKTTNTNVLHTLKGQTDRDGYGSVSYAITEVYPQVFSWLELLDVNVWIILGLMIAVAGFTMISGLLIIILERTQMIGLLKALGARNSAIRHTFLWFAAFIIGRGMLWGNIVGLGIVLVQKYTGIITLDAQTYYVSEAPMQVNIPLIILLNIATLLISIFVLIAPSYLVSHIHPARSMHYE
ncbi:FtsX-like permease family protein [Prevotella sp. E2-28]|uniref:ABC transporter permease n=1 Tax=Prevotella sp. E2-28 TaxID=2913620 RepID=UPI001EDAF5F7|nr:FtsX-like permease family protein [Prevotella sp. E2-28]UKK52719.1 ABC transporter permease [Prevotella sp. E2-28]